MGLFSWLGGLFDEGSVGGGSVSEPVTDENVVNPANGLPMIGGMGGVDVEGNPYGTDFTSNDSLSSGMDDSFSSFGSDDW